MQVNINLDKIILAYCLKNKQYALELSNEINSDYFHPDIQWLYKAIMEYFNDPKFKELPTVNVIDEYLKKNYTREEFIEKGVILFKEILNSNVDPAEFKWYIEKLKKRFNDQINRVCASSIIKIIKDCDDEDDRIQKVNKILHDTVINIDSINKAKAYQEGTLAESAKARWIRYKEVEKNPEMAQGILTGFSELDRITNGMHPGELLIVGGPTGSGKSVVMMNMAVNAYLGKIDINEPIPPIEQIKGKNVLYFSLEMPKERMEMRIDACISQVPFNGIRDAKLDLVDKEKYANGLRFQAKYPKTFNIIDMPRGATVRDVEMKFIEKMDSSDVKYDLVVVDYIGIMSSFRNTGEADWLELGYIAEEMHEFARSYKVPVITATQVNRPRDPNKQQYSTDRVARSDMIPQNANIIIQIGSRGDDEYTRVDMPIHIIKMRDGEKGSFTLIKDFSKMRVVDMVDEKIISEEDNDQLI